MTQLLVCTVVPVEVRHGLAVAPLPAGALIAVVQPDPDAVVGPRRLRRQRVENESIRVDVVQRHQGAAVLYRQFNNRLP